ncbi:MAG: porin, partial [Flavobacteriaceae bacterium]
MKNKILTTAISSAVLAMSGHMVYADTASDLVDALVTKGVLTEEEGALLSKNDEKQKKNQPIIKNKAGKFELESADGKNTIGLTGRMHFDYRATDVRSDATGDYESNDNDAKSMNDEFEMRRARIGVKGKLAGAFDYEVVLNGVGKDTNVLDTASLNWGSYKPFQIEAGVFKQAFNLEGLTSSNDIDFNERSFINQISPHKKMGLSFHGEPTNGMTYALTKYQQSWENADARDENNYSGRLTYDFASANDMKDSIFHLGVSGFTENYAMQPASSSNGGTETHAKFLTLKSAGRGFSPLFSMELQGDDLGNAAFSQKQKNTVNIDNKVAALEGIFAKGPFKLQGEYARGNFYGSNPMGGNNIEADLDMAYVSANWILTGEEYAKSYKGGIM